MRVDNVTFVESAIRNMKKEEFLNLCIERYFLNLSKEERKKKLSSIYDRICNDPEPENTVSEN